MDVTGLGFSQRHTHPFTGRCDVGARISGLRVPFSRYHCAIRGMSTALANIYDMPCATLRLRHGEEHGLQGMLQGRAK